MRVLMSRRRRIRLTQDWTAGPALVAVDERGTILTTQEGQWIIIGCAGITVDQVQGHESHLVPWDRITFLNIAYPALPKCLRWFDVFSTTSKLDVGFRVRFLVGFEEVDRDFGIPSRVWNVNSRLFFEGLRETFGQELREDDLLAVCAEFSKKPFPMRLAMNTRIVERLIGNPR